MNDDSLVDLFFSPGGILETTNDMLSDPLTKSRSLIEGLLQSSNGAVGSPSATQLSDSQYRALLAAAQEMKKEYDDEADPVERKKIVQNAQEFFHNPNLSEAECAALDGALEEEPSDDFAEMSPNTTTFSTSYSHRSTMSSLHISTHTAPETMYPSLISPENAAEVHRTRSSGGSFSFTSVPPPPPPPGLSPNFVAQPSPRTAATVHTLTGQMQSMGIASGPQEEYRPKPAYPSGSSYFPPQATASPAPPHPYMSQSPAPAVTPSTTAASGAPFTNVDVSLHLLSISVNGCFAGNEPSMIPARQAIYELIKTKNAHVIFLNNTGISDDKQLTQIRNEVKLWFKTESAMWASLKIIPTEAEKSTEDGDASPAGTPHGSPASTGASHASGNGGGTAVLVLGPLAPRTGWILSDQRGRYLSATSRVKPGLPEVAFVSVDFPFEPLSPHWTNAMTELSTLIGEEQQKGKSVVVAGRFCPVNPSGTAPNASEAAMEWFRSRDVYMSNISQFCNAAASGSAASDTKAQMESIFISKLSVPKQAMSRSMNPVHDIKVLDIRELNSSLTAGVTSRPPMMLSLEVKDWPKKVYMTGDIPPQYCQPPPASKKPKPYKPLMPMYGGAKYGMGGMNGGSMMGYEANTSKYYPYGAAPLASAHTPVMPPPPPMAANVYDELQQWRDCTLKGMQNLQAILQKYPWGTSRYVHLRELLFLMQQWAFSVGGGKVGSFGFADSQSMYVLNELSSLSPNDFMSRAENLLGQILTRWKLNVDAALMSHSSMRCPGGF